MGSKQNLIAHHSWFGVLVLYLSQGLSLVDLSSCRYDSLVLFFLIRLVIFGESQGVLTTLTRHDSPAVSHIG